MSTDGPTPTAKVGNLTRDPELRYSAAGKPWTAFAIAVRPYVPKGEPEPETTFYEVTAFGSLAGHVAECLTKGDRVVVVGRGSLEHWTGKDGVEHHSKKILADAVGPDLRFASVQLARTERHEPAQAATEHDSEPF